ncbi:MAG: hypothetical protein RL235_741 [Chlamydiota bacterium]|jgi:hypothetical protein
MFLYILPFLAIRRLLSGRWSIGKVNDVALCIGLASLLHWLNWHTTVLWAIFSLVRLGSIYIGYKCNIARPWEIVFFWRAWRAFVDSAIALKVPRDLGIGACLWAISIASFAGSPPAAPWCVGFLILALPWRLRQGKTGIWTWSFPQEISVPFNDAYPVYRKTLAQLSPKRLDISVSPGEKPHIIFLFLESFRAKNVGTLGAKIAMSPRFDAWAKQGVLFEQFHANGLPTFRSVMAALFGIPMHFRSTSLSPLLDIPLVGLSDLLKNQGYHNALIETGDLLYDNWLMLLKRHGFDTVFGTENLPDLRSTTHSWGVDDREMLTFAAQWLQQQNKPVFLNALTGINHHPWTCPKGWHVPTPERLHPSYQQFLQTFSYTDDCLGQFLDTLGSTGLLDRSIVFVMGDHGQEMGERGGHGGVHLNVFEETLHVPMLILAKGRISPQRIDDAASFVDLLPTVMDLLHIDDWHHSVGSSLLREGPKTVYFSLEGLERKMGRLQGKDKTINGDFYDLRADPDEKKPQIAPDETVIKSYFAKVDELYAKQAWAPTAQPTGETVRLTADADTTDAMWIEILSAVKTPLHIIDLSKSNKLTNRALFAIPREKGKELYRLWIQNCLHITDAALEWVASSCPNLMLFHAAYCHLLTNRGVAILLQQLPQLCYLDLTGVEDLTDLGIGDRPLKLRFASLHDIPNIYLGLAQLFQNAPLLEGWSASFPHTTEEAWIALMKTPCAAVNAHIYDAPWVGDLGWESFLQCQPQLEAVHVDQMPRLSVPRFESAQRLTYIGFTNCPNLTDKWLSTLRHLPLKRLVVRRCPLITEEGIAQLIGMEGLFVRLHECLDHAAMARLQSQGIRFY